MINIQSGKEECRKKIVESNLVKSRDFSMYKNRKCFTVDEYTTGKATKQYMNNSHIK